MEVSIVQFSPDQADEEIVIKLKLEFKIIYIYIYILYT